METLLEKGPPSGDHPAEMAHGRDKCCGMESRVYHQSDCENDKVGDHSKLQHGRRTCQWIECASPMLDLVRLNPRNEIFRAWASGPAVVLEPDNTNPEWVSWQPEDNQPLHARYSCVQAPPAAEMSVFGKWRWLLHGEDRIFRIVCATPPKEDIVRHFLHMKRFRRFLHSEVVPDWTYEPTTVHTLTIPKGSTASGGESVIASPPTDILFPNYTEKESPEYTAKTTEIEEIYLPVEIVSPTRGSDGRMLGKVSGLRQMTYAPELRVAKLFPGKDAADAAYKPIQSSEPFAIQPGQDPDYFVVQVHDLSGVWKRMATPTAKPGIRVTTSTPEPYSRTNSDESTNPALFQMDAATPALAPGWFSTSPMILVSNAQDNNQPVNGAKDGSRNDPSRLALPGSTVTLSFPGWQRSQGAIPVGKRDSIDIPVPIAAKATLDMKIFKDASILTQPATLFDQQLRGINEHFAQTGIAFDRSPNALPVEFPNDSLDSRVLSFYHTSNIPGPLTQQILSLAVLAGRVTATGSGAEAKYARSDAKLGILYCSTQPATVIQRFTGLALPVFSLEPKEQAMSGNFFHLYDAITGGLSGYDPQIAAHEIGHLLANRGHFGSAVGLVNYHGEASDFEKSINLMSQGPWIPAGWPLNHRRFSDEQESFMFSQGAAWLRNP